jgi:serine/threonine protein phosphatase PrpC
MGFALNVQMLSAMATRSPFEHYTQNRPNGLGQDFSRSGESNDANGNFCYLIVADGHGKGNYVKLLSSDCFSWDTIVAETTAKNMCTQLHFQIKSVQKKDQDGSDVDIDYTNDGTTLSIVKIYKTMVKCYWIGDSQIRIYDKGTELFKSKNHNGRNKKELKRLQQLDDLNYSINKVPSLCIVDPTTLTMKKYPQIHFFANSKCEKMMMTRALGHNEKLFPSFETKTILLDKLKTGNCENINKNTTNSDLCVVVASDGFWDMFCESNTEDLHALLTLNAEFLAQRAVNRWKQSWNIKNSDKTKTLSQNSIDDISIAIFRAC